MGMLDQHARQPGATEPVSPCEPAVVDSLERFGFTVIRIRGVPTIVPVPGNDVLELEGA